MTAWTGTRSTELSRGSTRITGARAFDIASALAAMVMVAVPAAVVPMTAEEKAQAATSTALAAPLDTVFGDRELIVSAYAGAPTYYRSDVHLTRPGGTDLILKRVGWDGDPFYFPIDGGVRSINWSGSRGFMVDFLHNKAIARVGKGSHGRHISNGIVDEVETAGSLNGQPAPARVKLTDIFDRLEFTHGHNVLLFTPVVRFANWSPRIRPYAGVGAGVAVPHVEVRFKGEGKETRTGEYQFSGPALQALAGIELRSGRASYYLEYKFTWASIAAALTGDDGGKDVDLPSILGILEGPGDLVRQLTHWWRGEEPKYGRLSTRLSSHQVFIGAGYVWPRGAAALAPTR